MATKQLSVDLLRIDGGTQLRAKIDQATVDDYRECWVNEVKFPPIVVFYDGTDYWLAGGFHRWHGANAACVPTVPCDVRNGTQRDAILFAAGDNQTNGLRRSPEDKRKAVTTLLTDREWGGRSDRWVAEQCGVGDKLVGEVRNQLRETAVESNVSETPQKRVGRDGKARTVPKKKPKEKSAEPVATADVKNGKPSGGGSFDPSEWEGTPAKPDAEVLDGNNKPVPAKFRPIFARRCELLELEQQLQSVAKKLADNQNDPLYTFIHAQGTVADIDNAKRAIRFARPFCVCPYCQGSGKGCKACKAQGWVPKLVNKQAPAEMRS